MLGVDREGDPSPLGAAPDLQQSGERPEPIPVRLGLGGPLTPRDWGLPSKASEARLRTLSAGRVWEAAGRHPRGAGAGRGARHYLQCLSVPRPARAWLLLPGS